jgi:catechol 2,3-dioxygenase-like lactoylglutathione lyase family enzyme
MDAAKRLSRAPRQSIEQGVTNMLDHISIGVADIRRTKKFYDAALQSLGYSCLNDGAESLGYGDKAVSFWISPSTHPVKPDLQSGLHFCFAAPTRKAVDAFHVAALSAGGKDNGGPGLRTSYGDNYYAAFVIDPDGYRLEAYCGRPA